MSSKIKKVKRIYLFIEAPDTIDHMTIKACLKDEKIKSLILNCNKESFNEKGEDLIITKNSGLNELINLLKEQVRQLPSNVFFNNIRVEKESDANDEINEYIRPKIKIIEKSNCDIDLVKISKNDLNRIEFNLSKESKNLSKLPTTKKKSNIFGCF